MKAITLQQPLAWAVLTGAVDVVNVSRSTPHRGRLWVHASKLFNPALAERFAELISMHVGEAVDRFRQLPRGVIHGSVVVGECTRDPRDLARSPWAEPGAWHLWTYSPSLLAEPVPAAGARGLWEVPAAVAERLEAG